MAGERKIEAERTTKVVLAKGASAAALTGISFITEPQRVFGANDRVRIGVCGLRGQGFAHVAEYARMPNVETVAVCDVDENIMKGRLADMDLMSLPIPKTYSDVRKLLEDSSIDAISIATPNHWHALMGIWALQAGKDVYIEKPCCHNLWEGRQLVRATKKYNRIVQHGTNNRSAGAVIEGIGKMREGLVGDVYFARGLCFNGRDTIGRASVEPVPPGVNYDLWTGPSPLHPFTRNRFHYNWHWFWDTGNGDIGNQGIHQMDVARWGLGVKFPNKVSALGGHFMFDDDQETPNTLNAAFEFNQPEGKPKLLEFEVRHWITNQEAGIGSLGFGVAIPGFLGPPRGNSSRPHREAVPGSVGDIFYGSKGYMVMSNEEFPSYRTWLGEEQERGPSGSREGNNWQNFINCVRSRKLEELNAPIEEGYMSCALVHLANASYRLGRTLNFDPESEQVIGDEEANKLLRGTYRAPYVVPEEV
ncbi:MAG TPA: Gfo/Idh/MocA family oxidoreductase [Terriglobia bacterium]|nr:Gfo/Idh/MocA family oxidoreductase [Terriglobia bacterium]